MIYFSISRQRCYNVSITIWHDSYQPQNVIAATEVTRTLYSITVISVCVQRLLLAIAAFVVVVAIIFILAEVTKATASSLSLAGENR